MLRLRHGELRIPVTGEKSGTLKLKSSTENAQFANECYDGYREVRHTRIGITTISAVPLIGVVQIVFVEFFVRIVIKNLPHLRNQDGLPRVKDILRNGEFGDEHTYHWH